MNRTQKAELVDALTTRLAETPLIILADYRGVTVKEIDTIRRDLESKGVEYRVVKNTLARRAIQGTDKEPLGELLTGMTGMVISGEDPIATAKAVRDVIKPLNKLEKFIVKGGFFEGDVLDGVAIQKVADLPGREELMVMLLRTIQEGPRQVLGVIQGPARDLVYLLKNYENKLSEDGGE
ncbi:MAG: 50S ribosomal protein L10 [Myxococcota bacterium]